MRRTQRQSGFALLMTLVLVVLAGVALVGIAQRSMFRALQCQDDEAALKRRWATRSLRETLLARVGTLLDRAERGRDIDGRGSDVYLHPPQAKLSLSCRLAGIEYRLVLTDEQAKADVNAILADRSPGQVRSDLLGILQGQAGSARLRLRPLPAGGSDLTRRRIAGYGQVFDSPSPAELIGAPGRAGLADRVTCWTDGRLSIRRTPDRVLRAVCTEPLGRATVDAILAKRRQAPYQRLGELTSGLDQISRKKSRQISRLLTDTSKCFGLWIIANGKRRSWYTCSIGLTDGSVPGPAETEMDMDLTAWYVLKW
jgi:type II secretory pathway component PulK